MHPSHLHNLSTLFQKCRNYEAQIRMLQNNQTSAGNMYLVIMALLFLFSITESFASATGHLRHDEKVKMMKGGMMGLERRGSRTPDARGRVYNPQPADLQMMGGSAGMPGGWVTQDVNDEGVQKAAKVG